MKEGKSINQFPRQTSLTGDELLLVNQKQNDGTYVSRRMSLSDLRDYINTDIIPEQPEPIIPADDGDEFEFNVAGSDNVRTLAAGTWECIIVGGGGGMFSKSIGIPRNENGSITTTVTRYRGHSSPMIKGTFTLDANTTCKFHVGDLPTIGSYTKQTQKYKQRTGEVKEYTKEYGEPLPTDNDGDSYVYDGNPSYILMGNIDDELTTNNSIVAVKAQKWYISTGDASNKNYPWGWQYWDGQTNPYNTRFSPTSDKCEDGANGYNYAASYAPGKDVSPGKTTGTDYGRTPSMVYEKYLWWDEVCQTNQTAYRWINGTGTGGYIYVKKLS